MSRTEVRISLAFRPTRTTAYVLLAPDDAKRTEVAIQRITALILQPDTTRPQHLAEYECDVSLMAPPFTMTGLRISAQSLRGVDAHALVCEAQWQWDQVRAEHLLLRDEGPASGPFD